MFTTAIAHLPTAAQSFILAAADDITQTSTPNSPAVGDGVTAVRNTKIFDVLSTVSAALGLLLVMFGIIQLGFKYMGGKSAGALRQGVTIVLIGSLMAIPGIAISLLGAGGSVINTVVESITSLVN